MSLFALDEVSPDFYDQCDGRNEKSQRCQLQADHGGECSFLPLQIGDPIEAPFSACHGNGTYGEGEMT